MEDARLTFLATSLIVPTIPTARNLMYLSSLDLFWREWHYNRRLIFYEISPHEYPHAVDRLKQSLSEALVYFYPWAGRLSVGEDGRVVLDCNDLGVEFVEASVDFPFTELVEDNFQWRPLFDKLSQRSEHKQSEIFDIPLLSIQVTQFVNGGMALGLSQSHVVADGHSLWHFMKSWAECGRQVPVSMPPVHDRAVFRVDNPSKEKAFFFGVPDLDDEEDTQEQHTPAQNLAQGLFHFSDEVIQTLKRKSSEGRGRTFTSYEVLCADMWKRVTLARKLKEKARVNILILADCRKRLSNPLPSVYFGNAIVCNLTVARAGELVKESLGDTASRIHEAVAGFREESLWEFIHWLETHDNSMKDAGDLMKKAGMGMVVASSPRFPVYEVDFGWGRPVGVRAARVKGDGEMVLFGVREGGGSVDICMALKEESMERLEENTEFVNL